MKKEILIYIKKNPIKEKHEEYKQEILKQYCQYINYNKKIEILKNNNGKPYIKDNPFYFNITHSYDYYIMACFSSNIGIDIEKIRDKKIQLLAKRYFSKEEQDYIQNHDQASFFDIWAMKESYTKFLGESIIQNLNVSMIKDNSLINSINQIHFYKLYLDKQYRCYIATEKQAKIKEIYI